MKWDVCTELKDTKRQHPPSYCVFTLLPSDNRMGNGLAFLSHFIQCTVRSMLKALYNTCHTHPFTYIHTLMADAAIWGANCSSGAIWGSVSCTRENQGIEPVTVWLLANLLYYLRLPQKYMLPYTRQLKQLHSSACEKHSTIIIRNPEPLIICFFFWYLKASEIQQVILTSDREHTH